ncbi:TraR/DksA family transcriptional regulator [Pseudomonadota bacterium]
MFTVKKLTAIKDRLIRLKKEIVDIGQIGIAAARTVELDQTRVGRLSRMDALQGQAMSQEANRRRQAQLKNIDAAIIRIEQGEYGYCLDCGDEIAAKRLEFDPATPLCINCASNAEKLEN